MTNQEQYELICEKAKKYDRLVGVLDKIRAEVLSIGGYGEYRELMPYFELEKVLEIIDKYGKEQE